MKLSINVLVLMIILLPILISSSCTSETPEVKTSTIIEGDSKEQPSQTSTGITLITIDELFQLTENNEDIVIVDVRSKAAYQMSHIKGAISVPDSAIRAGEWHQPDGKIPVMY